MKKLIILTIVIVAGSMSATIAAKKKQKKVVEEKPVLMLATSSDTLSYTAGITITDGLLPFLTQQMGVDTMYMSDFVRGFNEVVSANGDPKQKAYVAGMQIARQVKEQMLARMKNDFVDTPDSIIDGLFYRGFCDALAGDTVFTASKAKTVFGQKTEENQKAPGVKFLAENAKKEGVVVLPSGLQYKVLQKGEGKTPQRTDKVKVHYEGRLVNGKVFDASKRHGDKPVEFGVTDVIKGWTEALLLMPVGSKWQLYIPYDLAYGARGTGRDIKPYATLVFDVELVDICEPEAAKAEVKEEPAAQKPAAKKGVKAKRK